MYYEGKKSGQIPAFGNWDYASDLPITKYFECARQAGLIRPSSSSPSSCQCGPCVKARCSYTDTNIDTITYKNDLGKARIRVVAVHVPEPPVPTRKGSKSKSKRGHEVKERKREEVMIRTKELKEEEITATNHYLSMKKKKKEERPTQYNNVKPIDEDLYKIPSNTLHNSNKKKMLGFFSKCLVPPCRA